MVPLEYSGPNAEQIRYWNETSGPKWVALQEQVDAQIRPLGLQAMDRARIDAGQRVLDVGCGCGETTLELARRVGSTGAVTGVDISAVMLERARQLATQAGLPNVRFENADAQTHAFPAASFDMLFSRFGIMFFAQPEQAFANLRRSLRPGGRLAFVSWQAVHLNPWMLVPMAAAAQHVTLPLPTNPHAPGPFAFADADRVRGILETAGFTDLVFDAISDTLSVGGGAGVDQTVDFLMQMGPAGAALREASSATRTAVAAAVRDSLAPYVTPAGVRMEAAAWVVTGRAGK